MQEKILGKNFFLPDDMRTEMRKQYGILYPGNGAETIKQILDDLGRPTKLITVGDITTFNLLKYGIIPDISIVDEKTCREPADLEVKKGIRHSNFRIVHVKNPASFITQELISALQEALKSDSPYQIMVKGEEDLAALPAIVLAPISSAVIYGLPNKGAILVRITPDIKNRICALMERMIYE